MHAVYAALFALMVPITLREMRRAGWRTSLLCVLVFVACCTATMLTLAVVRA